MKNTQEHGDAYYAVRHIYDKSPGKSWQRLNGALYATLKAAITAHLSFEPDDFSAIRNDMKGVYWMGNSTGSVCGEGFYTHAVECGHTPACISFEKYAERPAALWPEAVKTPARLCIGSEFVWEGLKVCVTNLHTDKLVACSYRGSQYTNDHKVGDLTYFEGGYRIIESLDESDGALSLRLSAKQADPNRVPDRVLKITYEALAAKRKEYDANAKKVLAEIAAIDDTETLEQCAENIRASRLGFRPFDVETFSHAIIERRKAISGKAA